MLVIPQRFGGLVLPNVRGGPATLEYVTTVTTTENAQNYTFSSVPTGAASAGKMLVLAVGSFAGSGNTRLITGLTVNGNAATLIEWNTLGSANSALFTYVHESSASVTVVISHANTNQNCHLSVYAIHGLAVANRAPFFSTMNQWSSTETQVASINVPANGIIIAVAKTQHNTSSTWSVSDLTADYNQALENRPAYSGSLQLQPAAIGRTISFTPTGGSGAPKSYCIATWGN